MTKLSKLEEKLPTVVFETEIVRTNPALNQPSVEVVEVVPPTTVEEKLPANALQLAEAYADHAMVLKTARKRRAELVEQIVEIDRVIAKADANTNKAREALLRSVEYGL